MSRSLYDVLNDIRNAREIVVDTFFKLDYDKDHILYLLVHDCFDLLDIAEDYILSELKSKENDQNG